LSQRASSFYPSSSLRHDTRRLLAAAIAGMEAKKAEDIRVLDLSGQLTAPTDAYLIGHAGSHRQVEAIADAVEALVIQHRQEKPWHREGSENKAWILLDYVDMVVHIMLEDVRRFYAIEELWADAPALEPTRFIQDLSPKTQE
jgi:ribosome-associated protein